MIDMFWRLSRFFIEQESIGEKKQSATSVSVIPPTKENPFLMMKQQLQYEDASRMQFTLDNSDSLFSGPNKNSSLLDCRAYASSQDLGGVPETDTTHNSVRQFIDDWPENSVDRSARSWSDLEMQSDRTHLSISIPMASSDLISATSSPTNDRVNLSPLRLSRKSDPVHINLGVGTIFGEPIHKQNISWESSMGGPLGEVLHHTGNGNNRAESKNSSLLNLMKDRWDSSPSIGSSPTGVLQKTTFRSLSNSSTGSSPRAENKSIDGINTCNELLGSTLVNSSSSLPAM